MCGQQKVETKEMMNELERLKHELQSTKIALQAIKEELQSLNEESSAVKMDLQARLAGLQHAIDDLKNFWDNAPIAMLFLNLDMNVIRFTPSIVSIYPLNTSDIGRPINHLMSTLIDYDVVRLAQKVLADGNISDTEEKNKHNGSQFFGQRLM